MILTALRPVLYRSKQYRAGDALPADKAEMVDAWIEAGSAVWTDGVPAEMESAKAVPASAPAGLPGKSNDEFDGEPVGKIPDSPVRKVSRKKK